MFSQCVYSLIGVKEFPYVCLAAHVWFPQHLSSRTFRENHLSDLPQALLRASRLESQGSLSDPHRLGAEKPGAGVGFHSLAQETDPGGGEEKTTMIRNPKQVNATPEPSCRLIKMKWCSG